MTLMSFLFLDVNCVCCDIMQTRTCCFETTKHRDVSKQKCLYHQLWCWKGVLEFVQLILCPFMADMVQGLKHKLEMFRKSRRIRGKLSLSCSLSYSLTLLHLVSVNFYSMGSRWVEKTAAHQSSSSELWGFSLFTPHPDPRGLMLISLPILQAEILKIQRIKPVHLGITVKKDPGPHCVGLVWFLSSLVFWFMAVGFM